MNPCEYLYYLGLSAHKYLALRNRKKLPFRVISTGNITVGGTGKTPAVIAIAEEAKERGFLPIVLTRGYKGKANGPCFVTGGDDPILTADEAGDEPLLMATRLKGVPIIKGEDRYEAGLFAVEKLNLSPFNFSAQNQKKPIFILDDGFQHWKLFRDKDIVLIDSTDPFGSRRLLPSGRLREPLSSLGRADIILLTRNSQDNTGSSALKEEIKRYNPDAPIFTADHLPVSVRLRSGEQEDVGWLNGKKVFCFCAIANPESFRKTVESAGADVKGIKAYKDHHLYSQHDIYSIAKESGASGAVWIITTEKDMVKLATLDLPENILIIEIKFSADCAFFESLFA